MNIITIFNILRKIAKVSQAKQAKGKVLQWQEVKEIINQEGRGNVKLPSVLEQKVKDQIQHSTPTQENKSDDISFQRTFSTPPLNPQAQKKLKKIPFIIF